MKRLFLSGIVGIFIMVLNTGLYAQENQVSKTYHQEYPVSSTTKLLIDNKYGAIDVKNWNENKITIDVIVKLENHNKDRAQKQLDQIKVEFSHEGNEIKAITELDESFLTGHGWFKAGEWEKRETAKLKELERRTDQALARFEEQAREAIGKSPQYRAPQGRTGGAAQTRQSQAPNCARIPDHRPRNPGRFAAGPHCSPPHGRGRARSAQGAIRN